MKHYPYLLFSAIIVLLSGCSEFAYQRQSPQAGAFTATGQIPIDQRYDLYVRTVQVATQSVASGAKEKVLAVPDSNPLTNKATAGQKIIEVEYLFISRELKRVIYISCIADRYENHFTSPIFPGLDHPNAADFRVFFIGRIPNGNTDHFTFYFKDGQHTDNWTIHVAPETADLQRIEQQHFASFEEVYEMHDALAHPIVFHHIPNWSICFQNQNASSAANRESLQDPLIYYVALSRHRYTLEMHFPGDWLSWKNKYVNYKPE